MTRTALITGVGGQDGAYLARLLLEKGLRVVGTSRGAARAAFPNLLALGIGEQVAVESLDPCDAAGVSALLARVRPDEIYHLAGQSSVGRSFELPAETIVGVCLGTLNILEAIRTGDRAVRLFVAGSGECFGDTGCVAADESTPFKPRSPYGVAKASAFWQVACYREAYGLKACTGILFNHESPLRSESFVTQKIVAAAVRIAAGSREQLSLGDISIQRDWGWAPEYVDAMWAMLQQERPVDYVIATGRMCSLKEFAEQAFACLGLDWRTHVKSDSSLLRPTDAPSSRGNPARIMADLGWRASCGGADVAQQMVAARQESGVVRG